MGQRNRDETDLQATYDALTVHVMRRTLERRPDIFDEVYASLSDSERSEVDAACDRHAARMRAEDQRGW